MLDERLRDITLRFNPRDEAVIREARLLTKALRLKEFGRCPSCDLYLNRRMPDDPIAGAYEFCCIGCGWAWSVTPQEIARKGDDVFVQAVSR